MPSDTQAPAETDRPAPSATPNDAGATSSVSTIPTTPDALKSWLLAGSYKSWSKESKSHTSTGPHAASVLTFVNAGLGDSLAGGSEDHPAGAAAVKEFLDGNEVTGWAVAVKTSASSDDGKGWYWYETFNATPGKHGIEGQGESICVNCHASGRDFFLSPYPLK